MHGSGVGTLRFLKRDPQGNIEELLSEDGNQDAVWRKLRIYLKEGVVEGSRIVIEARVGDDSGLGDIAIDDVVFHQGCSFIPGLVIHSLLFFMLFARIIDLPDVTGPPTLMQSYVLFILLQRFLVK